MSLKKTPLFSAILNGLLLGVYVLLTQDFSFAETKNQTSKIELYLKEQIGERYPDSEITLLKATAPSDWNKEEFQNWTTRQFYEKSPGQGELILEKENKTIVVKLEFRANRDILVASKRVFPKSTLSPTIFSIKNVDVTRSPYREINAAIPLKAQTPEFFNGKYETIHTTLPGQPLVLTNIVKRPDVKKGEWLKLEILSGPVRLTASAEVLESGNINDSVRVKIKGQTQETVARIKTEQSLEISL